VWFVGTRWGAQGALAAIAALAIAVIAIERQFESARIEYDRSRHQPASL